jgi:hypothetical protein
MSVARVFATAAPLPNGEVLVAGGGPNVSSNCLATAELLNPATGQWTTTGSMTTPRCNHSATLLANGQVLVSGGPATGTWQATGSLDVARELQLSALLQNGKVLVTGDRDFVNGTFTDLASAELFDPSQGKWSLTGSLSTPDGIPFGSLLANGDVLVARSAFFTPATGTWTSTDPFPAARGDHCDSARCG